MQLYSRTELDTHYAAPVVASAGAFIVVKLGWFSFAFLLDKGEYPSSDLMEQAMQQVTALFALDQ